MINIDFYLKKLYQLSLKSYKNDEVPVGAIIIHNKKIIGSGYNNRQKKFNVCGHAEINAIIQAEKHINDWRLNDCILISTLKPCEMCEKIIKECRISKVYYLLNQKNVKYNSKFIKINTNNEFYDKYIEIFNDFFKKLR